MRISGITILANKIGIMEVISPKLFLQIKQKGIQLISADLKLINYLSKVIQLNNSVINAIIYYCLRMNNINFTSNYVEKIDNSVKRENIDNELDALNYLESPSKKEKKIQTGFKEKHDKEKYDELEYNKLLKLLEKE